MATPIPFIFPQEFDNDGNPLADGKIYTYQAGTSTPKVTYQDANGEQENTNPIILDGAGRYKCFLGEGAYDLTLTTSTDAFIDQAVNIGGTSAVWSVIDSVVALRALGAGQALQGYVLNYGDPTGGGGGNIGEPFEPWMLGNGEGTDGSYNFPQTVSHNGGFYVSLENNNYDEPGTSTKWQSFGMNEPGI